MSVSPHTRRAAVRRPDPQPAGVCLRGYAGPAGHDPGRTDRGADRAAARRRTRRLLPPARPGPGSDQRFGDGAARRGPRRRLDRRPPRRRRPAALRALMALGSNPALIVVVRPDRVVAAVAPRYQLPRLPWPIPASALCGCAENGPPPRPCNSPGHLVGEVSMFATVSLLLAAACLLPAVGQLPSHPQDAARRRARRDRMVQVPAHRRGRTSRRPRRRDRPMVASARRCGRGRDGPAACWRGDHPPAGRGRWEGDGTGPGRPGPHDRLPGHALGA